jgi:hypothetical protein
MTDPVSRVVTNILYGQYDEGLDQIVEAVDTRRARLQGFPVTTHERIDR